MASKRTKEKRQALDQQKANLDFNRVATKAKKPKWIAFIAINFLLLVVLFLLGIVTASTDNGLNVYGTALEQAVYRNQVVSDNELKVGIVRYKAIDVHQLEVGQEVLVYDETRDGDYLWVQEIIDINGYAITLRFNEYLESQVVDRSDILFLNIRDANLLGTMLYAATQPRGYVFVILFACLLSGAAYMSLVYEKKEKETLK